MIFCKKHFKMVADAFGNTHIKNLETRLLRTFQDYKFDPYYVVFNTYYKGLGKHLKEKGIVVIPETVTECSACPVCGFDTEQILKDAIKETERTRMTWASSVQSIKTSSHETSVSSIGLPHTYIQ